MDLYVLRRAKYYAVKFTGENKEEIIKFLNVGKDYVKLWKSMDTKESFIEINAPSCNLGRISYNYWILIGSIAGDYKVMSESDFMEQFEKYDEGK